MKRLKTILILCITLCVITSCKKEVDMTLMQQTLLENTDIRQIKVGDGWEVNVIADSSTFVELEYSAYLEESLKMQMAGTCLEIGFAESTYPETNSVFRATVHLSQLEKIDAQEAANILVSGTFSGPQLTVELNEASICKSLAFTGNQCEIKVDNASKLLDFHFEGASCRTTFNNASQFNGQIHASDFLDIEANDASLFVNKGGTTAKAQLKLSGNSLLNIVETQVEEMEVALSENSEATVWVTSLLKGSLKETSTLYYKGDAQIDLDCSEDSRYIPL